MIEALHNVELTPEVLGILLARINAEGVALVDDDVDDLAAEIEQRVQSRAAARTIARRRLTARHSSDRLSTSPTVGTPKSPYSTDSNPVLATIESPHRWPSGSVLRRPASAK